MGFNPAFKGLNKRNSEVEGFIIVSQIPVYIVTIYTRTTQTPHYKSGSTNK